MKCLHSGKNVLHSEEKSVFTEGNKAWSLISLFHDAVRSAGLDLFRNSPREVMRKM